MNCKPLVTLTIAGVAFFGVLGLYVVSAEPAEPNQRKVSKEEKILQAVKQLDVKVATETNEGERKKQILVFSRTMAFRHESIGIGKKMLAIMAETTGSFDVLISDELTNFDAKNIHKFDAICFLNTTMNVFSLDKKALKSMSAEDKKLASELELKRKSNLLKFVSDGKGFIGIHSASDTFYEWEEYGRMLGGYFDGHPWNANMEVSIKAEEKNKDHALLAGVIPADKGELRFKEEIYQFKEPYHSKSVTMLLRLAPEVITVPKKGIKRTDNDFGVSWIKPYGEGRVYYCSLGHNDHIYWNKHVLKHYYAGIMYALGHNE